MISTPPGTGTRRPCASPFIAPMNEGCSCERWNSAREPIPIASAPYALPWAISARIRLVPSCAAVILMAPRASRTAITSGLNFFSTPLASAASRILRATSRVSSAMGGLLFDGGGIRDRAGAVEAHRQHPGDMEGAAAGAILDLMPARRTVGDNKRGIIGAPHRREQRQFGH